MKFTSIFAVLFAVLIVPAATQAEIVIDSYTAGTTLTQFGLGTASQTTIDGSILGGERDESITVTDQGGSEFFGILGFTGDLDVAQGSLDQVIGSVLYDNFGTLDLTQGGMNDSFELGFLSSDIDASITDVISVTVTSGTSTATRFVSVPPSSVLPKDVFVKFASFTGVDLTAVDAVELGFDFSSQPGRDFELGSFSVTHSIPEPATGFLALVGMLALIGRRRR